MYENAKNSLLKHNIMLILMILINMPGKVLAQPDKKLIETLLFESGNPEWTVKVRAVRKIYATGNEEAIDIIRRKEVWSRIVNLTESEPKEVVGKGAYQKLIELGEISIKPLIENLTDKNAHINTRKWSGRLLGEIGKFDEVFEILRDHIDEHWVNYEVNAGIKILFSRQDLNKITELLDSHNWKTRLEAAKALREFGPSGKDAVSKLIKTLSEEENSYEGNKMRNYVIDALGAIKDQSAIPALLNEVNSELSTKDNMWLAVKQLGNFGENARKAIPVLIRTLNNENSSIRSIAAEMLGMVGKGSSKVASNLLRSGFITSSV